MIRLTVLCDNNTYIDRYFIGEPAFSCLIEDGESVILFDTGYSDAALKNALSMGIDLSSVTGIALSHGHNDHTGGLRFFIPYLTHPLTLTACPEVFRYRQDARGMEIGSPIQPDAFPESFSVRLTEESVFLSEHTVFLGRIPRVCPFETDRSVGTAFPDGKAKADDLPDDTALTILLPHGQFIVTGCSHSGIVNICSRAGALFPDKPICGILGGFHLLKASSESRETAETLSRITKGSVYPCHCTCFEVKAELAAFLPVREPGVSLRLTFDGDVIRSDP